MPVEWIDVYPVRENFLILLFNFGRNKNTCRNSDPQMCAQQVQGFDRDLKKCGNGIFFFIYNY